MTLTKTDGRRWTPLSIATLVLGFVVWWPLGVAALGYILWGGHMDSDLKKLWNKFNGRNEPAQAYSFQSTTSRSTGFTPSASGNAAFDRYREQTLRRLEEEQQAFSDYVNKLRAARDQEEFDRFMSEKSNGAVDKAQTPNAA